MGPTLSGEQKTDIGCGDTKKIFAEFWWKGGTSHFFFVKAEPKQKPRLPKAGPWCSSIKILRVCLLCLLILKGQNCVFQQLGQERPCLELYTVRAGPMGSAFKARA